MKKLLSGSVHNKAHPFLKLLCLGFAMLGAAPANADNAVKLKVLLVTTGDESADPGLMYIKPVLDEMGVPYDILNAVTTELTQEKLSLNGCDAAQAGCVGNYNGIILTSSDLVTWPGGIINFTSSEWDILHSYETDFHVREAVLSGWPAAGDPHLDYGLTYSSLPSAPFEAQWSVPATDKEIFEYVNRNNPLTITDYAVAAKPHATAPTLADGTVPSVVPLLKTANDEALVSIVEYTTPGEAAPKREVLFSSITNAWFLIHSQVLAYEFVNWATQGVFVGGRFVHLSAHLDDLFIEDELWNSEENKTDPSLNYRLNSGDIINAVNQQNTFQTAHPTAGSGFKLDFAFNGYGAVVDPAAAVLNANLTEDLVAAVIANKSQFRFINHTLRHVLMDKPPVPANPDCDYATLTTVSAAQAEITKNRTVWGLLGLPEQSENNRILVSGNHSGLKDHNCTVDPLLHPEMADIQSDDVPFPTGANPLFFTAAAKAGVDYLASDASQKNQNVEKYVTEVNDGSKQNRILLPRWPTSLFFNIKSPEDWVDEYNYIFHDRFVESGQNPCAILSAICAPRTLAEIHAAEADTALRHMLSYKKWPHFFHQINLAAYNAEGNTLMFDWLDAVFTEYEKYFILPVKNYPYYQIGDKTKERLTARSATISAQWDRTTNKVTLSADKVVPNLLVTGIAGGDLYGGQLIREITINKTPRKFAVNQALDQ